MKQWIFAGLVFVVMMLALVRLTQAQSFPAAPQWVSTTSPSTAITQYIFGRSVRFSGQGSGCAQFDSNGILTTTGSSCSSGGGSGSVGTSTIPTISQVPYWTTSGNTPEKLGSIATGTLKAGSGITLTGTAYILSPGGGDVTINNTGGGAAGTGNIATSTNEVAGRLGYFTSNSATPALLGQVATTSVSAGTGISLSANPGALVGGSALTITNNGVISGSCAFPVSCSGTNPLSISWAGLATTSPFSPDQFIYTNHAGSLVTVASSSLNLPNAALQNSSVTVNTAYPLSGGGALSLGGSLSLTFSGLATTSPWTQGQLAEVSNNNTVFSVATTSIACGTYVTCTGFTALGNASTIALNGTLNADQILYTNHAGTQVLTAASSSIFGFTPANNATTITINGTANQITSSAGSQDLSANRTWTLSLPNNVIFPIAFNSTYGTTTYASSTALTATNLFSTNATSTNLAATGQTTGCAQFLASGALVSTGSGCGSSSGLSSYDAFTHSSVFGETTSATSSLIYLTASPVSLAASSTAWFDQIDIGSSTASKMATSTDFGNWLISGTASSTALIVSNLGGSGSRCIHADAFGNLSATGSDCGSGSGTFSFTPTTDYGVTANATTTPLWFQGSPFSLFASSTAILTYATTTALTITGQAAASGNNCLQIDTTGFITKTGSGCGGSASAAGNTGAVQFNAGASAFGGDATNFFWDNTNKLLGIGSSTPWSLLSVASSTFNYARPLFAVATSSDNFGLLASVFATSSTMTPGQNPLSDILESGVRMIIGGIPWILSQTGSLDQLFVNGRINTGDEEEFDCLGVESSISSTAAITGCMQWTFGLQGWAGNLNSSAIYASNGSGVLTSVICSAAAPSCNNGTQLSTSGGAGVWFLENGSNVGTIIIATTTPVMDGTVRITTPQAASSTYLYFGFDSTTRGAANFALEPTAGCYFVASSTLANWQAQCRTSMANTTTVDTGIASSTSNNGAGDMMELRIEADNNGARFYIANSTSGGFKKVANITTNIPNTTVLHPNIYMADINAGNARGFEIGRLRLWLRQPYLNY